MKKVFLFAAIVINAILFSCRSGDSPRDVSDKFLLSMSRNDFQDAKKYGTEDTRKLLDMMIAFSKMTSDSIMKEMKYEIVREEVKGDKAIIFYKEEGKDGEQQLPMIREGGKWKVMMSKESINGGEGSIDIGATSTDTTSAE